MSAAKRKPLSAKRKPRPNTRGTAATTGAKTKRFFLVLYQDSHFGFDGNIGASLVMKLRKECEDKIDAPRDHVELDLWLESPGGDAHAAYKLAMLLRAYAHRVRVVVPDYAKSAATLLSLAADEIYMAPAAELGPLDAQIPREGGLVTTISALDVARSVEDLAETAFRLALDCGAEVLQTTRLARSESLSMMLDFAAKFMEPVVSQLDPTLIHWSNTLLDVSKEYAERLLSTREGGAGPDMSRIPNALVSNYPTHGFVISFAEAHSLGLPVCEFDTYPYAKEVMVLHRRFDDERRNDIRLLTEVEVGKISGKNTGKKP